MQILRTRFLLESGVPMQQIMPTPEATHCLKVRHVAASKEELVAQENGIFSVAPGTWWLMQYCSMLAHQSMEQIPGPQFSMCAV